MKKKAGPIQKLAIGSAMVKLIADGDRIVDHVRRGSGFEPHSRQLWGIWCGDGGTVLDVGAYTGLFAIGAAMLGCRVTAFEPMPFNAERLNDNANLNDADMRIVEAAVSDHDGDTAITFNPKVPFTSGASLIRKKGHKLSVAVMTIDSLNLPQVTAIKIDVERGEPLVLAGARETLARCRPKLLVESLGGDERAKVMASLTGYRLADVIDTRNLVLLPC